MGEGDAISIGHMARASIDRKGVAGPIGHTENHAHEGVAGPIEAVRKAHVENGLRHGHNRYMRQESKKVRAQIIHMRLGYEGHSGVRKNDRT